MLLEVIKVYELVKKKPETIYKLKHTKIENWEQLKRVVCDKN